MDEKTRNHIVSKIFAEWKSLSPKFQPPQAWVREYAPIPLSRDPQFGINELPVLVWHIDERGLHEGSLWTFWRFWVIQVHQPWCKSEGREQTGIFNGGRHEIGLAAFANFENTNDVYTEWIWGGRFARGNHIKFDASGKEISVNNLWVS